jgi:hypothetical protein
MKGLKKGTISLNVTGTVNITSGDFPDIEINEKAIAAYIADALGLIKKDRESAKFPGTVSLVIENFGTAEITNTMTDDSSVPETEPDHDVNLLEGDPDAM